MTNDLQKKEEQALSRLKRTYTLKQSATIWDIETVLHNMKQDTNRLFFTQIPIPDSIPETQALSLESQIQQTAGENYVCVIRKQDRYTCIVDGYAHLKYICTTEPINRAAKIILQWHQNMLKQSCEE